MKDLMALYMECVQELDTIGVEIGVINSVTINTRAKKRWGQCKRNLYVYDITISSRLLENSVSDESTKNTIIHELLHTVNGCFNHGENWKRQAELVNDCYSCYNIKRATSAEEKGVEPVKRNEKKYIIKCQSCGQEIKREKMSKVIAHPENYICGCGGKFKRIK